MGNEEYSGRNKYTHKKSNLFRLETLLKPPKEIVNSENDYRYPAAEAYHKLIENEQHKPINSLFYDFSDKKYLSLLVLTDTHWGSISAHFHATVVAQMIAKYHPFIYLGYNGDNRNNNINTEECVGSSLDNALIPTIEQKLLYEQWSDSLIQFKTLFINSGNHENGNRTAPIGVDLLATFFAGTPYYSRYSRFSTLLTIRLKADNKQGYKDVRIYVDHGTSLKGADGTKLDQGMKLAKELGADIAIFGHVHQDLRADYRGERKILDKKYYNDMEVVILPAPMGSETYALDKRMETPPNELKLITIGTKQNDYLLDSTQRERRNLEKLTAFCDVTSIPTKLWKFGVDQAKKMKQEYLKINKTINTNEGKQIDKLIESYFKKAAQGGIEK